jgi:hypothetical protein
VKNSLASIDEVRETDEDYIHSSEYKSSQNSGKYSNGNATPSVVHQLPSDSQRRRSQPSSDEFVPSTNKIVIPSLNFDEAKTNVVREITNIKIFDLPKAEIERADRHPLASQTVNYSLSTRTLSPSFRHDLRSHSFKTHSKVNKENVTSTKKRPSKDNTDRHGRNTKSNQQKKSPFGKNVRKERNDGIANNPTNIDPITRSLLISKERSPNQIQLFRSTDQSPELVRLSESPLHQVSGETHGSNQFKKSLKKYGLPKDTNIHVLTDFLSRSTKTLYPMAKYHLGFQSNSTRSKQKSQGNFEANGRETIIQDKEHKPLKGIAEDQTNDLQRKNASPNPSRPLESHGIKNRPDEICRPNFSNMNSYFNQVLHCLRQAPSLGSRSDSSKPRNNL